MEDLTGKRYGKLTVIKFSHKKAGKYYWLCQCDCGKIKAIVSCSLKSGNTKSCGCEMNKHSTIGERTKTHGQSHTRLHNIWLDIKKRCNSVTNQAYERYGGRGIQVCKEWMEDYMNFYNWAVSHGYNENLSIDRIDNNGNYEPNNCRWTTKKQQANNRRTNVYITKDGITKTLAEWSDILQENYFKLYSRYRKYGTLWV